MNKTKRKDLIYDGKAKKIFSCQDDNLVIQYFKDDATAFVLSKAFVRGWLDMLVAWLCHNLDALP